MFKIDLHMHTTASDGALSPKEIIDLAIQKKMKTIAITDHNSISSIQEALEYSEGKDIEVVPGIEISCESEDYPEVHIVGLFIDYKNKELIKSLENLKQTGIKHKIKILEKLNELGYEISLEELKKIKGDVFGRPTIAKGLLKKYPDRFSNIKQIFKELLGANKKAYVKPKRISIKQTIQTIKNAKGISILAHPGVYLNKFEKIINEFIAFGGQGIEINYPYDKVYGLDKKLSELRNIKFKKIAEERGLLVSGGSDFHGGERDSELGGQGINDEEFMKLRSFVSNNQTARGDSKPRL